MNLFKLGLIRDAGGQIARPRPPEPGSSTIPALGVELSDILPHLFANSGATPMIHAAAATRFRATTTQTRPRRTARRDQETPLQYRNRMKKKLGLVDIDQDIREMDLDTLRRHFGYKNGKIQRGLFSRNVIWQILRFTKAGRPPKFVQNGGNVRSLWYHVKSL